MVDRIKKIGIITDIFGKTIAEEECNVANHMAMEMYENGQQVGVHSEWIREVVINGVLYWVYLDRTPDIGAKCVHEWIRSGRAREYSFIEFDYSCAAHSDEYCFYPFKAIDCN